MATKVERTTASHDTPVELMPLIAVTTEGIPAQEHVEHPVEPTRERRAHTLAWAMAGILGAMLIVAVGIVAYLQGNPAEPALHMGLTPQAWQEFRTDERASTTPFLNGLTLPAWQAYRSGEVASATVVRPYPVPVQEWAAYRASERTAQYPAGHMGLSGPVWRELRIGEQLSTTPLHMGLTIPAWQEFRNGERSA
jgi:hypothetical protein